MKLRVLGLGFILLGLIGCASLRRDEPIDIYQEGQSYKKYSFDEVWSAALRSIDDIGFIVRNAAKKIGLIHAVAGTNPDPDHLPPLINIVVKEENGTIDVNFHIEFPGQRDETGKRRDLADRFFRALKNSLRK